MNSKWQVIRRYTLPAIAWCVMVAAACVCGARLGPLYAYAAWAGAAALLCIAGALLIRSQPMGKGTVAGMVGYQVVHFGFKAGHGRLPHAAAISWLVWCVVGAAAIWVVQGDRSLLRAAMALSWVVNVMAMFFVVGIALRNRPKGETSARWLPPSLAKGVSALAGLTLVSAVLWFGMGTPGARLAAVLMAAAPVLVLGGAYGLMVGVMLTAGKNVRWN